MSDIWPQELPAPDQSSFQYIVDLSLIRDEPFPQTTGQLSAIRNTVFTLGFTMTQRQVHLFAVFYTHHQDKWFRMALPGPTIKLHSGEMHLVRFVEPYSMSKTQFETYSVRTAVESRIPS